MALSSTQVKAIFLIMLIAGQDCARIHRYAASAVGTGSLGATMTPEEQLREANKQCSWALTKGGCTGPGCAFRPLALDASLSESCRLTDDYMLNVTHKDAYINLSANVLDKKSEKFTKECAKARFWHFKQQSRCYRRAGHMLQSAQLLMRAEKEGSKEEATRERPEIDRAIKNLASLFGTDSSYILELRQNMRSNVVGVAKDLEGSFKSMASTIYHLLRGNDAEKEQARRDIRSMRKNRKARASEQDQAEIKRSVEELMRKHDVNTSKVEDGWQQIDELVQNPASDEDEAGALLQVGSDSTRVDKLSIGLVIVVIVLLLLLIVLWLMPAFAAVFWGVILPIIVVLIVVIIVFLIVRYVLGLVRGRETTTRSPQTTTKRAGKNPARTGRRGGRRGARQGNARTTTRRATRPQRTGRRNPRTTAAPRRNKK